MPPDPQISQAKSDHSTAEAIERHKNVLRGNIAQAIASLGQATYALGHTIRTSPMRGVFYATEAGLVDAERKIAEARAKMRTASFEAEAIHALELSGASDEEGRSDA